MMRYFALLPLLAAAGSVHAAEDSYQPRPKGTLTFSKDVALIVFANCAECHRPGEVAPFSLLTYRDVQKRAKLIQKLTSDRQMPPWKAAPGHGDFLGARRLTADQIGVLKQWADEGAAEGDAKDLPKPPTFVEGWALGKPDLVVTMAKPFAVPAEGNDIYRNFIIPMTVPEGKYLSAVEFRPGNRRVVHHAALGIDDLGVARKLDGQDGQPGFTRFSIPGQLFPGPMAAWVPGREARPLPEQFSLPWKKNTDLILQLHLHPSGKAETEQSTLGFYFTDKPPQRSMYDVVLIDRKIAIEPGDKNYRTRDQLTLPVDTEVYGIFPHMHLIGKEIRVTATLPDGKKQPLLYIDAWDFKWQNYYQYAAPVKLPKGTQLLMECVHDNSAENPSNPNTPPKRVTWGEQTADEMAAAMLQISPLRESDRQALTQALGFRIVGRITAVDPATGKPTAEEPSPFVAEALNRLDKDKDGKLSLDELKAAPRTTGVDPETLLKKFDKDGDGKLDAKELAEAIRTLLAERK